MVLLKDLVIPAGTVFSRAPSKTERSGDGHISAVIGLSKNTSGTVEYYVGDDEMQMKEWFGADAS